MGRLPYGVEVALICAENVYCRGSIKVNFVSIISKAEIGNEAIERERGNFIIGFTIHFEHGVELQCLQELCCYETENKAGETSSSQKARGARASVSRGHMPQKDSPRQADGHFRTRHLLENIASPARVSPWRTSLFWQAKAADEGQLLVIPA